ncbi:MAG: hypothetical protein RLZZ584_1445 [Pseudomonadota bacterium]|jgi:hypothetical protein
MKSSRLLATCALALSTLALLAGAPARAQAVAADATPGAAPAATTPGAPATAGQAASAAADPHAMHRQAAGGAKGTRSKAVRPTLAVSAAIAPDASLWVMGVDQGRTVWLRRSSDSGRSWSSPQTVDSAGDRIVADGDSRPSLAFGPRRQVVLAWAQPLARPYTGEIRMVRSGDGGQHFSAPYTVHADRQEITHRFQSVGFDALGVLHTVWIDKRDAEAARAAAGGRRDAYTGAAIYRNESRDGGASFGPDLKVAEHSCECCRIALAPMPDGRLGALWRHVFDGERDHAFAPLGAGTEPARASQDGWKLDVCPHHGPGLTPAAGGGYHAVWFGERQGAAGVRYGRLDADGRPHGTVLRLPDEQAEHADVMSQGRRVAVVWRSFDGQRHHLRAWVSTDDGASFSLRELGSTALDNDHPRLAAGAGRMLAVWRTEDGLTAYDLAQ